MKTKWLTSPQASKKYNITTTSLFRWAIAKRIKTRKVPKPVRMVLEIEEESLKKVLQDPAVAPYIHKRKKGDSKRGPTLSRGYRLIWQPDHHKAYFNGYVPEHILVAEQMLGRPLTKEECVHHKNRVKTDNRPENLVVFESQSAHMKAVHSQEIAEKLRNLNLSEVCPTPLPQT